MSEMGDGLAGLSAWEEKALRDARRAEDRRPAWWPLVLFTVGCAFIVRPDFGGQVERREFIKTLGFVGVLWVGACGAYVERVYRWKNRALLRKLAGVLERRGGTGPANASEGR